jgi:phosphomannomutase
LGGRIASQHNDHLPGSGADRVGLTVKHCGEWRILHGNHTGTLLTWWLTKHFAGDRSRGLLLCSTVPTQIISVIARREGFNFQETLTGFKWLCNAALGFEKKGGTAVLAFE